MAEIPIGFTKTVRIFLLLVVFDQVVSCDLMHSGYLSLNHFMDPVPLKDDKGLN